MKIYYLSTNPRNEEFFLDDGGFLERREYLEGKDIFKQIRDIVKKDRKSELVLIYENFPNKLYNQVEKFFWGSDVNVSLETITNLR